MKKELRSQQDLARIKQTNAVIRKTLDSQTEQNALRAKEGVELRVDEESTMLKQWDAEAYEAELKERQRMEYQVQVQGEMNNVNQERAKRTLQEKLREEAEDKAMLNAVLTKEQQENSREADARGARAVEAAKLREHHSRHVAAEAADEQEVESFIQDMNASEYAKQVAKWEKEAEARKRLQDEVVRERNRQVAYKKDVGLRTVAEEQEEKQRMQAEVERIEALEHQKELERQQHRYAHQADLVGQMHDKQGVRQMSSVENQREYETMSGAESEYQNMIKREVQRAGIGSVANSVSSLNATARKSVDTPTSLDAKPARFGRRAVKWD
jgi:hypothetical protein